MIHGFFFLGTWPALLHAACHMECDGRTFNSWVFFFPISRLCLHHTTFLHSRRWQVSVKCLPPEYFRPELTVQVHPILECWVVPEEVIHRKVIFFVILSRRDWDIYQVTAFCYFWIWEKYQHRVKVTSGDVISHRTHKLLEGVLYVLRWWVFLAIRVA